MKIFLAPFCVFLFTLDVVKSQQCGVPKVGIGNVIGGHYADHGQYPWSAAIMKIYNGTANYHGGGTLISNKFVITAAHCILNKNVQRPLLPREIMVILGAYNLDARFEVGREIKYPLKLHIHPDWNQFLLTFDADIAMIEFEIPVTFSNYIQPICLWESNFEPPQSTGIVVAYGKSEDQSKKHEHIPKVITMPIHSQNDCISKSPGLNTIASGRTFCAGSADGTGVCLGDSGSGFVVKSNNVHYLKGIVSSSLVKDSSCDVHNYEIFTNVLKFKNWIKSFLSDIPQNILTETIYETYYYRNISRDVCGVMSSPSGLIQHGKFSSRTEFPWMATIIYENDLAVYTGALISNKHVLAKAGIFRDWSGDEIDRNKFLVKTSKYKIYLGSLQHVSNENVYDPKELILHPNLKRSDHHTSKNDIAIVVLSSSVEFSDFIRPACLWTFNEDITLIKNLPIYAVGYGIDENGYISNVRKHAKVILSEQDKCEYKYGGHPNFLKNNKVFCITGNKNGMPCYDDLLFVKYKGKWFLRGIHQVQFNNHGICLYEDQILYHDITQNLEWIETITNQ